MTTTQSAYYNQNHLSVDTETTGIDPMQDRIVTLAMVMTHDDPSVEPATKTWLLNQDIDIPLEASNVHGITTEIMRANGMDPKVALTEIAEALTKWDSTGKPMIFFNASFDVTLLIEEFKRNGVSYEGTFSRVIDPFILDRHFDKWRKGKRTLTAVSEFYGVALTDAHSADADSLAASAVSRVIGRKYAIDLGPDELFTFQKNIKHTQAVEFQKYLRKTEPEAVIYTGWPYRTAESDAEDIRRSPVQDTIF